MSKQVKLVLDYEDYWFGTNMHVDREDDKYFYGTICERGGSYKGKFPKDRCKITQKDKPTMTKWDKRFLELAKHIASWSEDRSTKVGCILVGPNKEIRATGYNGFPRGIKDQEERHERPAKYAWTEHAERNAIYNAARTGVPLEGTTAYLQWFPCVDCARALIQSGISEIVCTEPDWEYERWNFKTSRAMLEEAQINIRFIPNN